jgi:hypothetical protein
MAGLTAILTALARVVWRDVRSLQSLTANNFILFLALVMYQQPQSIAFFAMILGILLIGPLAADPLRKIPAERLLLWPLSARERLALRLAAPAMTPIFWLAIPLFFKSAQIVMAFALIALGLLVQIGFGMWGYLRSGRPAANPFRFVPRLPGKLGGLIQKDIRQLLSTLDPYIALMLAAGCLIYRFVASHPDPEAFLILSLVVTIAMSTCAQCLFGLDLPAGVVRYHILPLHGYEILLAKDIAFMLVLAVLVGPLAPLPGLAAGLMGLAVGHHASVLRPIRQTRWRFTGGEVFPTGFLQMIGMVATGVAVERSSKWYLALAAAVYLGSLWYYGRRWSDVR